MAKVISEIQRHLAKEIAEAESASRFWREEIDWMSIENDVLRAAAFSLVEHIDVTLARLRIAREVFKDA